MLYKPGGANHEGVVYTDSKKADGHTILHINGSHSGYFNLPHFTKTFDDFSMVAKVERHLYAIAVRCDDPEIKTWADLIKIEKASPGKLSMGSNKPGSLHHRQHILINNDQGIKMSLYLTKVLEELLKILLVDTLELALLNQENGTNILNLECLSSCFIK